MTPRKQFILTFVAGLTSGLLGAASFFWLTSVSVYLDNHQSIDVITARSIRVVDPYSGASLHLEPTALRVSDPSGRPTIALGGGLEGTSLVMMDQAHHERCGWVRPTLTSAHRPPTSGCFPCAAIALRHYFPAEAT